MKQANENAPRRGRRGAETNPKIALTMVKGFIGFMVRLRQLPNWRTRAEVCDWLDAEALRASTELGSERDAEARLLVSLCRTLANYLEAD